MCSSSKSEKGTEKDSASPLPAHDETKGWRRRDRGTIRNRRKGRCGGALQVQKGKILGFKRTGTKKTKPGDWGQQKRLKKPSPSPKRSLDFE